MPRRLWLPNVEEALPEKDSSYSTVCVPKTLELTPRFLLCLKKGDAIITPKPVEPEFAAYIAAVSGLGPPEKWLFSISARSNPYSLADSVLADRALMRRLRGMAAAGDWTLEPYLQSPRMMRLSRETGVPTDKTPSALVNNGIITFLNDKGSFKEMAQSLGVKTPGGYLVDSMPALEKAIDLASRKYGDKVMLRKTFFGGGLGNLPGSRAELLPKIGEWFSGGRVLVEPFLDITSVAGSLASLTEEGVEFSGVDIQTFCDGKWNGFEFPHPDKQIREEIERLTLLIAWAVRARQARGYLNLDWAITRETPGVPLALECNFRQNGFAYVLDFACRYLKASPKEIFIRYREGLSCGSISTPQFLQKLAGIKVGGKTLLLSRPGQEQGAALMTPPLKGKCSVAIFSRDGDYIKEATAALSTAGL